MRSFTVASPATAQPVTEGALSGVEEAGVLAAAYVTPL